MNRSFLLKVLSVVAISAVLSLSTHSAKAALLAYEGFNYSSLTDGQSVLGGGLPFSPGSPNNGLGNAGNSVGAGDSFGWGHAWSTSAGTNNYRTSGLGYTGGATLQNDGGALQVGGIHPMAGNTTAQLQRTLPIIGNGGTSNTLGSIAADYGGTLWVSFLYQHWGDPLAFGTTNAIASAYLAFMANGTAQGAQGDGSANRGGTDIFGVGAGNNSTLGVPNGIVMGNIGGNNTLTSIDTDTSQWGPGIKTYLFVLRLDVDLTAANDTITLWENPTIGGVGPVGPSFVSSGFNISSVNGFRFQAGNQNGSRTNAVFIGDELRLGTTFGDVTPTIPEPGVLAVLGVGLSGLIMMARRKRA